MSFVNDSVIAIPDNEQGKIHLIGIDGKHYGTYPKGNDKRWRHNMWDGTRMPDGSTAFRGNGGVWKLKVGGAAPEEQAPGQRDAAY
jgi:hypothetical protein